jgi:hypothetical protein
MEAVTAFARRQESETPVATATLEANHTLAVTATYLLSEEGRKASLLAGGDGRAVQQLTMQVPANRLHLVSVDADGVARLKLRPRYQLDGDQGVVRIDAAPTYDGPPEIEDLFREAARNHQLERAYQTERRAAKIKRRETDAERRAQVAQAFLSDPTQRALVHPAPTPKRCYLATPLGRVVFDATTDEVPARGVPLEAHRRFRADLRARREQNQEQRAAQLALHEEKKRAIAEWIATHGTPEQQARQAAGVLPMDEAIEAITDQVFAVLRDRPRYVHDGLPRLQAHLREHSQHADAIITRNDLIVTSANAEKMTAAQWALVNEFHALVPDATVTLRIHKLAWKRDLQVALRPVFGVLVTQRVGPFTLRREYAAVEETIVSLLETAPQSVVAID